MAIGSTLNLTVVVHPVSGTDWYYLCWTGPNVKGVTTIREQDATALINQGATLITLYSNDAYNEFVTDFYTAGDQT